VKGERQKVKGERIKVKGERIKAKGAGQRGVLKIAFFHKFFLSPFLFLRSWMQF
jgi:hypothetical protein